MKVKLDGLGGKVQEILFFALRELLHLLRLQLTIAVAAKLMISRDVQLVLLTGVASGNGVTSQQLARNKHFG